MVQTSRTRTQPQERGCAYKQKRRRRFSDRLCQFAKPRTAELVTSLTCYAPIVNSPVNWTWTRPRPQGWSVDKHTDTLRTETKLKNILLGEIPYRTLERDHVTSSGGNPTSVPPRSPAAAILEHGASFNANKICSDANAQAASVTVIGDHTGTEPHSPPESAPSSDPSPHSATSSEPLSEDAERCDSPSAPRIRHVPLPPVSCAQDVTVSDEPQTPVQTAVSASGDVLEASLMLMRHTNTYTNHISTTQWHDRLDDGTEPALGIGCASGDIYDGKNLLGLFMEV